MDWKPIFDSRGNVGSDWSWFGPFILFLLCAVLLYGGALVGLYLLVS